MKSDAARPRAVIVGAGFGGLQVARRLSGEAIDVLVVDRHNYHCFLPLLYQVATAGLEPEEIARGVRGILRGQANLQFRMADVIGVDVGRKTVATAAGAESESVSVHSVGSRRRGRRWTVARSRDR